MRRGWSIAALLVGIATVPAFVMFLVVSAAIYASRINEVRADIDDRGRLIAAALAESGRYGVVSGNVSSLEATLQRMLTTDASIAGIQILDAQRHLFASAGTTKVESAVTFEHPIRVQAIDVDLFNSSGAPHGIDDGRPKARDGAVVGYSRVVMSPEPLMQAKRNGLLIAGLIVLAAAVLSAVLGLALSQLVRRPLAGVMSALRAIQHGNYDVEPARGAHGELGELQGAIVDMTQELAASRHELEEKVAQRTAELEEAVNLARAADDEKRRLIAHGNVLVEEERRRIAAEIHDQLNASLISVRLLATSLKSHGDAPRPPDDVNETAGRIASTAEELYENARRIVKQLRPEVLDTLGLRNALAEMVRHYDDMHPSCRFEFLCAPEFPHLHDPLAIAVYRIVQEALSNVVKHSHATNAVVSLAIGESAQDLIVAVSDNGQGIGTATSQRGLGLIGMRERASAAGGSLQVTANPSGGTIVELRFKWSGSGEPHKGGDARPKQ
jgi:two-component system, NarL family, sensor histidine kinase UhpB